MKHCKMCARVLPLSEFAVRSRKTLKPCAYCKECQRIYSRNHYLAHGRQHNKRRHLNKQKYIKRNRELLWAYLSGKVCVDCGHRDPLVFEFDHVRGEKKREVSVLVAMGVRWSRVQEELEKCDIRCANCHRRKTAYELKWFRTQFGA